MNRSWYSRAVNEKSPDRIHQLLAFGTLDEIQSLKKTIGGEKVKELFLRYPKKIYTLPLFNFIKNFILNITSPVNEKKYLKSSPRSIR